MFFALRRDLPLPGGPSREWSCLTAPCRPGHTRSGAVDKWGASVRRSGRASTVGSRRSIDPNDFFPVPSCVVFLLASQTRRESPAQQGRSWRRGRNGGPFTIEPVPSHETHRELLRRLMPTGHEMERRFTLALFFVNERRSQLRLVQEPRQSRLVHGAARKKIAVEGTRFRPELSVGQAIRGRARLRRPSWDETCPRMLAAQAASGRPSTLSKATGDWRSRKDGWYGLTRAHWESECVAAGGSSMNCGRNTRVEQSDSSLDW